RINMPQRCRNWSSLTHVKSDGPRPELVNSNSSRDSRGPSHVEPNADYCKLPHRDWGDSEHSFCWLGFCRRHTNTARIALNSLTLSCLAKIVSSMLSDQRPHDYGAQMHLVLRHASESR